MPGSVADILALWVGFASALMPVMNIEAYLGHAVQRAACRASGCSGSSPLSDRWSASSSGTTWSARVVVGTIRRRIEKPNAQARLDKWRSRTAQRPVVTGVLVLLSAASGFPPFAIVAVLAGQLRMNLRLFFSLGLVGRWLRFTTVLGGAEWVRHLIH